VTHRELDVDSLVSRFFVGVHEPYVYAFILRYEHPIGLGIMQVVGVPQDYLRFAPMHEVGALGAHDLPERGPGVSPALGVGDILAVAMVDHHRHHVAD